MFYVDRVCLFGENNAPDRPTPTIKNWSDLDLKKREKNEIELEQFGQGIIQKKAKKRRTEEGNSKGKIMHKDDAPEEEDDTETLEVKSSKNITTDHKNAML